MNIIDLIPASGTIPVHHGWLEFLLLLTFAIHIIIVNIMIGVGIIGTWLSFSRYDDMVPAAKNLTEKLTFLIAFAINAGVAPLLFIQALYGAFIYTSSILMGVYWLSIVLVLIIAYYSAYICKFKFDTAWIRKGSILISTVLLLVTGFIFTNNMTLMINPAAWIGYFSEARGIILNLADTSIYPRYLHFIMASIANGGLAFAIYYRREYKKTGDKTDHKHFETGMLWFKFGLVIQVFIGTWYFITLPASVQAGFLGQNSIATLLLFFGMLTTGASLIFAFRQKPVWSAASILITILIMVGVRDYVRKLYIQPFFKPDELSAINQYSPMIMFFGALLLSGIIVIYMLRLVSRNRNGGAA